MKTIKIPIVKTGLRPVSSSTQPGLRPVSSPTQPSHRPASSSTQSGLRPVSTMIVILLFFCSVYANAQNVISIQIKTSAQCEHCKDRIETGLSYEKGIKKSDLNLKTKEVLVIYNPQKTNPEKIRKAISLVGYDADTIPADIKAYAKLPGCCKKP